MDIDWDDINRTAARLKSTDDEQDASKLFARIYEPLQPWALNVARKVAPDRRTYDALLKEAVSDAMVKLYVTRSNYDPARPYKSWSAKIIANCARDVLRTELSRERSLQPEGPVTAGDLDL
jgi:DNA-directed RNA polymerase specialized sigma24 family protein